MVQPCLLSNFLLFTEMSVIEQHLYTCDLQKCGLLSPTWDLLNHCLHFNTVPKWLYAPWTLRNIPLRHTHITCILKGLKSGFLWCCCSHSLSISIIQSSLEIQNLTASSWSIASEFSFTQILQWLLWALTSEKHRSRLYSLPEPSSTQGVWLQSHKQRKNPLNSFDDWHTSTPSDICPWYLFQKSLVHNSTLTPTVLMKTKAMSCFFPAHYDFQSIVLQNYLTVSSHHDASGFVFLSPVPSSQPHGVCALLGHFPLSPLAFLIPFPSCCLSRLFLGSADGSFVGTLAVLESSLLHCSSFPVPSQTVPPPRISTSPLHASFLWTPAFFAHLLDLLLSPSKSWLPLPDLHSE